MCDDHSVAGNRGCGATGSADWWPLMLGCPAFSSQQSCRAAAGWEDYLSGTSLSKIKLFNKLNRKLTKTHFHKTEGRRRRGRQALCSPQAFFRGCRWHTRWLQTPPAARSSPPCGLGPHGARPSHGTSRNSHWHLHEKMIMPILSLHSFYLCL